MPPIQEGTLPSVTNITPNSPPLPLFKAQVLSTWIMDGDKRSICTIAEPYGTYTPIDLTYPLITPPPLFSIHSWMVRTCPHLDCQILLNSPPTTLLQITRADSSLLFYLTFNAPPKFKLLSPPLFPPSPFWMCIKLRPTLARRDSLITPLISKDRLRAC